MSRLANRGLLRDPHEQPVVDRWAADPTRSEPFLSVVLPTYNRAHCLPAVIESVLAVPGDDFELIIIDNASTDDTPSVVGRYRDPRLRFMRYSRLVSMYANHNRCLNAARAPWSFILHSDTAIRSEGIAKIRLTLQTITPSVGLLFPGCPMLSHLPDHTAFGLPLSLVGAYQEATVEPSGWCVRTEVIRSVGGFDEDNLAADLTMVLLLAARGQQFYKLAEDTIIREEHTPDRTLPHFQESDLWYPSLAKSYCAPLAVLSEAQLAEMFRAHSGSWRPDRVVEVAAIWYYAKRPHLAEAVLRSYPRPHELWRVRRYAHIVGIRLLGVQLHQYLFNTYRQWRRSIRALIGP